MNKNTQDCCSLTFKNFYMALAYFYAHLDPRNHFVLLSNKIKGVHLVPVWDDTTVKFYDIPEKTKERVSHKIEFLMSNFCNPHSNFDPGLLAQLQNFFDVFPVPTPHATLKKDKEELARKFFCENKKCVERAGIILLQKYLEHRMLNKTPTGECSKSGFGLVLSMDYDDFPYPAVSGDNRNPVSEDLTNILVLVP